MISLLFPSYPIKNTKKLWRFQLFSVSLQKLKEKNYGGNNMITKRTVLNEAQLELLDLVSVMDSKEEIEGLRKAITDYLGSQLKGELDKLWANGTLNEEKVESFRTLHERNPYHKEKVSC